MLIVDQGKPNAHIVLSKDRKPQLLPLAQELQRYIQLASGATLKIASWRSGFDGNAIHLGPNPRAAELGVTAEDLEPEGFRIRCAGRDLVLIGKDEPGQSHAIYTFLERFCGVRWLWPGENGEVVPKSDTLEIEEGEWVEAPSFRMRHLIWEERERFLESVKDDTVVDYRWVKMCDAPRKGGEAHPFARVLEKLKKARKGYKHLMKRSLKVRSEGFSSS